MVDIEYLHTLVDRFEKATEANWSTPHRTGSLIQLGKPEATEIVVTGDLHGQRENFNKIVKAVALERYPHRHLVLQEVVHGGPTYPNGGDMSHMLLEDVAKLKVEFPDRVHFLLSNHELSECMKQAVKKSGIPQNLTFAMGLEHAYGPAAGRIAECYEKFILSCPLAIRLKNGVFISHSIPDRKAIENFDYGVLMRKLTTKDLLAGGSGYAIVWGRDHDNEHTERFAKKVKANLLLSGHEPCREGYQRPNDYQLIFDASGSYCYLCGVPTDKKLSAKIVESKLKRI